MARTTASSQREAPKFMAEFANLLHDLLRGVFDPYRPELHYMRGPGPKWRAKHLAGQI